jgi:hypothetical protein
MEASAKKRKVEENGVVDITVEDTRKMLEPFTREQMLDILQEAATKHLEVLEQVRSIADKDLAQRNLFVHGLGWDTNTESLKARLDHACVEESMTSSKILFSQLCNCRVATKEEINDAIEIPSKIGTALCMAGALKKAHETECRELVRILITSGVDPKAQDALNYFNLELWY